MNWDDVRFFLELARKGSARSAGASLGLSHTTVARRADQLEASLGTQLFDRDVGGYRLTGAGEAMLESAEQAEDALLAAERRLQGRDAKLKGNIVLTTSTIIATCLMMPGLAKFSHQFPDINLEILVSPDVFNLARREADIAIRFFGGGRKPPQNLVGRKLVSAASCYYASESYLDEHRPWESNSTARWIGWDDAVPFPGWVQSSAFPHLPVHGRLDDPLLQVEAARSGMGLTVLPCFVGDQIPDLVRIPGCKPFTNYDIWLLSHPDLRDAARHRTFRHFVVDLFEKQHSLLTGKARQE